MSDAKTINLDVERHRRRPRAMGMSIGASASVAPGKVVMSIHAATTHGLQMRWVMSVHDARLLAKSINEAVGRSVERLPRKKGKLKPDGGG